MKDIASLLVFVIILLIFSANNAIYSQDIEKRKPIYSVSLGGHFGFVHGQSVELVYPTITNGEFLSELLWNMKPVYYFGVQVDLGLRDIMSKPGFFTSLAFKAGIPGDSGIHENRDWMSIENDSLTHYSKHTIRTNEFYQADAQIGASIPFKFFYVKPFISGSWMRFSFSGRDGYGIYARKKGSNTYYPIHDAPIEYDFSGMEVIRYEQDWLLIAAGFSIGTNILTPFLVDFSFQISPFTYCAAVDQHFTNGRTFYDFTSMGLLIEPKGSFTFKWKLMEISLELNYRYISRTRGDTYIVEKNSNYAFFYPDEGGAALSMFVTRFAVKVCL